MSLFARDTKRLSIHKLALRHHTSTPAKTLPTLPHTHNNPRKKHPLASPRPIFFPNNVRRNHSPFMNHKAP